MPFGCNKMFFSVSKIGHCYDVFFGKAITPKGFQENPLQLNPHDYEAILTRHPGIEVLTTLIHFLEGLAI